MSKRETVPARRRPRARAAWPFAVAAVSLVNFAIELVRFLSAGEVRVFLHDPVLVGRDALVMLLINLGIGALFFRWGLLLRRRLQRSTQGAPPSRRPLGFDWYSRRGRKRDRREG